MTTGGLAGHGPGMTSKSHRERILWSAAAVVVLAGSAQPCKGRKLPTHATRPRVDGIPPRAAATDLFMIPAGWGLSILVRHARLES